MIDEPGLSEPIKGLNASFPPVRRDRQHAASQTEERKVMEREMSIAASFALPVGTTIVLPSIVVIILIILVLWFLFFR